MRLLLFVCTGNICRSPTADGVMRDMLAKAGRGDVRVDSAGTHGYHVGEKPDERAIATARRHGVAMDFLRARKFAHQDFADFDMLIAMDRGHLQAMRALCPPEFFGKLHLFLDFVPGYEGQDVPDPYYGDQSDFDEVYTLVEQGCSALVSAP